jgi:hypothetical protein
MTSFILIKIMEPECVERGDKPIDAHRVLLGVTRLAEAKDIVFNANIITEFQQPDAYRCAATLYQKGNSC